MLIAQISDLHCREADSPPTHGFDNNGNIARAVSRLNGLSPRPDLVIATGDLTAKGDMAQYEALDALLAPLEMPLYLLPGNHDVHENLVSAFDGRYGIHNDGSDFVRTVVDGGAIRLIALDTSVAGHHSGAVPSKRTAWLDDRLSAAPETPTLIFMHHPPFETGIWWMDRLGILEGLDGLAEVLGRHSQVIGMVAGHLHRTIHGTFAGIPVTVAASTCYAVDLDIRDEAPGQFTNEPPGFVLHRWSGGTLVSHSLFLDDHEIHEVMPNKKRWQVRLERMRLRQPVPKSMGSIE